MAVLRSPRCIPRQWYGDHTAPVHPGHPATSDSTADISREVCAQSESLCRRDRAAARSGRAAGVAQPVTQRLPESLRVAGREQQAGPAAIGCVAEGLRYATDLPGDDRKPARKRLGDDHAVRLRARGQHQGVRLCVGAVELVCVSGPVKHTRSPMPLASASRRIRSTHSWSMASAPTQCVARRGLDDGQGREQHVMALVAGDGGDAHQSAAGLARGRELGGVDSRRDDVDGIPAQGVVIAQPSPAPLARGDDGCRRLQRRDLARLAPAACAGVRRGAAGRLPAAARSGTTDATRPSTRTSEPKAPGPAPQQPPRARTRRAGATGRTRCARGPTSQARQARDRPDGRTRCRRSAAAGRRSRRGRRRAPVHGSHSARS